MAAPLPTGARLYVGNLPEQVTEEVLSEAFVVFGDIKAVQMPREGGLPKPNEPKSAHKGYAYVEFREEEDAQDAQANMHGARFYDQCIRVDFVKSSQAGGRREQWDDSMIFNQQQQ